MNGPMNKMGIINTCIMFVGIAMIILFTFIYMLYFQVGVIKNSIKDEVFYALMNMQVAFDKEELALGNYVINKNKLEETLNLWVKETAKSKINVDEIIIKQLLTNTSNKTTTLKIELLVKFTPLVNISDKVSIKINDEIDISLLKLK